MRSRRQKLVFQLFLKVLDERPIFLHPLEVLRSIVAFKKTEGLDGDPVVLAERPERRASKGKTGHLNRPIGE